MTNDGSDPVPTRRRWRIWLRRTVLLLVILPPLAFGCSNLWLATRGRAMLADRLQQRWGLETRIGGASWSPWHGLTLRQVEIAQPAALRGGVSDPLVRVDTLWVAPVWRKLLRRQVTIGSLEISGAKVALTVEMVAQLAQREEPPAAMPLAMAAPPNPSGLPAAAPGGTGPVAAPEPAIPPPATPAAAPSEAAAVPVAPSEATRWARFQGVDFQLTSASSHRVLAEIGGFAGEVPFAGDPAKSTLAVESVELFGEQVLDSMRAGLSWQNPVITVEPEDPTTRLAGLDVRWGLRFALMEGLPAQVQLELPRQAARFSAAGPAITVEARAAAARAVFLGRLLVPGTWHGELLAETAGIEVKHKERTLPFDRASCATVLRGGMLSCLDARLVGEEFSVLGNGALLADGRLAAVARLVAPQETVGITLRRVFPGLASVPACVELSTPQRVACDVSLAGTWQEPLLRIGGDGPFHPLRPPATPP